MRDLQIPSSNLLIFLVDAKTRIISGWNGTYRSPVVVYSEDSATVGTGISDLVILFLVYNLVVV